MMRSKNITNILLIKKVDFVAPLCCYWVNCNITTDSGDKVQTPTYLPHRHRLYHYASYHEIVHGRVSDTDALCHRTHAAMPCSKMCFFATKKQHPLCWQCMILQCTYKLLWNAPCCQCKTLKRAAFILSNFGMELIYKVVERSTPTEA